MAAEKISYAEVLRRQAAQVDNVADQYALVMDGGEHDTSEVQPARRDAAALRELAGLLTELQRGRGMVPDEREALEYRVVAALRAGYRPEGVGQ